MYCLILLTVYVVVLVEIYLTPKPIAVSTTVVVNDFYVTHIVCCGSNQHILPLMYCLILLTSYVVVAIYLTQH